MNLEDMIAYLSISIEINTAKDIYELPRPEFTKYVERCEKHIPRPAIPYAVLILLLEEQKTATYKFKRFFKCLIK